MAKPLQIKVCGMTSEENIREVGALGMDYMGFIHFPPSPRHLDASAIEERLTLLPSGIQKVLVTVNARPCDLLDTFEERRPDVFQLHGEESPQDCAQLRNHGEVWKVVGMDESFTPEKLKPYQDVVDAFLFDTRSSQRGGTGIAFDWDLLQTYTLDLPFWLSGGIGPEHATAILALDHPQLRGIDLNSRFELEPGIKDAAQLSTFIQVIKSHELSR